MITNIDTLDRADEAIQGLDTPTPAQVSVQPSGELHITARSDSPLSMTSALRSRRRKTRSNAADLVGARATTATTPTILSSSSPQPQSRQYQQLAIREWKQTNSINKHVFSLPPPFPRSAHALEDLHTEGVSRHPGLHSAAPPPLKIDKRSIEELHYLKSSISPAHRPRWKFFFFF